MKLIQLPKIICYKLYEKVWIGGIRLFNKNYNKFQIAPFFLRVPMYFYHKYKKYPQCKTSWKGDHIELTINEIRFKYPSGFLNIKRRNILYHLWHFEASNLNYFNDELMGYLKEYIPKENDTIIDLGAYGGMFSIYCAVKMGNKGRIIAFEPSKENLKLFRKAIELNNLTNIEIVEK